MLEKLDAVGAPYSTENSYFWKFDGELPGPTVTVLGAVHGNETAGVEVIEFLQVLTIQHGVMFGTLKLGIGNPQAFIEGKRGTDDNNDLNRFGDNPPYSEEAKREQELKEELEDTDVLLDIHETILPSDPMLIVTDLNHKYAKAIRKLGIKTIFTGPGLLSPEGDASNTDTYTAMHGGLGITVERGCKDDAVRDLIKYQILYTLMELGIFDENFMFMYTTTYIPELEDPEIYDTYASIRAEEDFEWKGEWKNKQEILKGTVIAKNGDKDVTLDRDSVIIFPKTIEYIKKGTIVCMLATKK